MAFLPKMGYNRHTARAIVYGAEEHGGIGVENLYAEQSIEQIKALVDQVNAVVNGGRKTEEMPVQVRPDDLTPQCAL